MTPEKEPTMTRAKQKPPSPKRKLILALRRAYKGPHRRFTVEHVSGTVERLTCTTCGVAQEVKHTTPDGQPAMPEALMKRLSTYRNESKITGHCPNCTKEARDRLYPLPKE